MLEYCCIIFGLVRENIEKEVLKMKTTIIVLLIMAVICFLLIQNRKTPAEQAAEDDAQEAYLKAYNEKKHRI